ncbi:PilW family protein [Pseudomonas mangiferae]|uniref:Pilus assembly protein PilW n=1 Tax=Pseudomonas mangiferae TaxID=2593654 RepID=A0A553H328_9PSED|nr:PilW family protein [Pseudomonas mangiferae]TRX76135.1 pilus assembly protein PilW [Pseudomonas mangiferae]
MNTNAQRGLSIVELMIALAISSFLILGIVQIYLDNKRSYLFQQGQGGNQENSRFAAMLIEKQVIKAGYRRLADNDFAGVFTTKAADAYCEAFGEGETVVKAKAKDAGEYGVCVRYQTAFSGEHDCLGNEVPIVNSDTFRKNNDFSEEKVMVTRISYIPSKKALYCGQNSDDGKGWQTGELVTSLADFKLEYGVETDNQSNRVVNAYRKASELKDTDIIRSLRVYVLASSENGIRMGDDAPVLDQWYEIGDVNKTALSSADKRQLYQLSRSNQTLRNLMP